MILDVEFEELNSTFEADFGEVYRISDADIYEANEALDECVHGYVTGAGYAENVSEAVSAIEDVGAAIAEKGVELSDTPGGYGAVIRNELSIGADINPEWTNWKYAYAYGRTDFIHKLKYSDTANSTDFSYMCTGGTKLTEIQPIDTRQGINFISMFQGCANLKSIGELCVTNTTNNFTHLFTGCTKLTDIKFEGEIPREIALSHCPLSMKSVENIVTHLKNYKGTENEFVYACKFKADIWNAFNATECTEGYDTWADYVNDKGWNL